MASEEVERLRALAESKPQDEAVKAAHRDARQAWESLKAFLFELGWTAGEVGVGVLRGLAESHKAALVDLGTQSLAEWLEKRRGK